MSATGMERLSPASRVDLGTIGDSGRGGRKWRISPLQLDEDFAVAHFALPDFRAFALAPARAVFKTDVPSVPAADHFTGLHNAFTEGKSKMGAQVLAGVNAVVPAE